jgi:DNA repair exonuclease SbcCD ATPase subunit
LDQCEDMLTLLTRYEAADAKRKDNRTRMKAVKVGGTELEELMKKAEVNMGYQSEMIDVMTEYKKTNETLARMNGELQVIREQNAGYRAQLEKMKADCLTKIEIEKMMNIYKIYRDTIKQIPFRLIHQVKGLLERKVNDLLAMCTNFSVKFEIDEKNIDIYLNRDIYAGRPILINNSSGFERFISSLAIRIALMEISQLPSPNFMAIDEGWSCFDNDNINNIDVILDHLVSKFDYILTISHLQVIRQHCDVQIALRRDDAGYSHVNYC